MFDFAAHVSGSTVSCRAGLRSTIGRSRAGKAELGLVSDCGGRNGWSLLVCEYIGASSGGAGDCLRRPESKIFWACVKVVIDDGGDGLVDGGTVCAEENRSRETSDHPGRPSPLEVLKSPGGIGKVRSLVSLGDERRSYLEYECDPL